MGSAPPTPVRVVAIAALNHARVIGRDGGLPWHLPEDLKRFSTLTRGGTVLMGRRTYESLPERVRPLPGRLNVVASRSWNPPATVQVVADPIHYVQEVRQGLQTIQGPTLWIIGGGEIYRATISLCDELYLTIVDGAEAGDTCFPEFETQFRLVENEPRAGFAFQRWIRT